jgi:Domain of unknown function (DUF1996)
MRGVLSALGCALAAIVGAQFASATIVADAPARPAAEIPGTHFTSICRFSHRNTDDFIVYPGRPGLSHDHTYFGNVSTNANSTLPSLRRARTTCQRKADTAAYWLPTLFDEGGRAIKPTRAVIYYRLRTVKPAAPFPPGLRMIAGATYWDCGFQGSVPPSPEIPTCAPGSRTAVRIHVIFPNCWNGRDLDSPDHQSHMAYAIQGICPSSHPVAMPTIVLQVRYPVWSGEGLAFASGGQHSGHADFVNSWDQNKLEHLVDACLNGLGRCGRLGEGALPARTSWPGAGEG